MTQKRTGRDYDKELLKNQFLYMSTTIDDIKSILLGGNEPGPSQ